MKHGLMVLNRERYQRILELYKDELLLSSSPGLIPAVKSIQLSGNRRLACIKLAPCNCFKYRFLHEMIWTCIYANSHVLVKLISSRVIAGRDSHGRALEKARAAFC